MFQVAKVKTRSSLSWSSGQASTEYILLLVVTVGLVLALVAKVYGPFNRWAKTYMGSYIGCLLDSGELPALGVTGSAGSGAVCNGEYEDFSFAGGRPPKSGGASEGSGSSEGSISKSGSGKSSSSGSGSGSNSGGGSSSLALKRGFKVGSGAADGASGAGNEGDGPAGGGSRTRYYRASNSGGGPSAKRRPAVGISGVLAREAEKEKQKAERVRTIAGKSEDLSGLTKDKKFVVKPPNKKVVEEEQQSSWGLGKIFRLAIIIMLLIAIFLFIAGQAMQISKGMEKG